MSISLVKNIFQGGVKMRIEPTNTSNVSVSTEKVVPRMESSKNGGDSGELPFKVAPIETSPATAPVKTKGELNLIESDWIALIERANKAINGSNKSFEYSIHKATNQIMVKVIDKDTNEVIREIPSEKILDMVAKMWELNGLFVDERR